MEQEIKILRAENGWIVTQTRGWTSPTVIVFVNFDDLVEWLKDHMN